MELSEIKQIVGLLKGYGQASDVGAEHRFPVGQNVFLRTVTHHFTGKLVAVTPQELVLEDVSWIADDGRFHELLETGEAKEVEPCPPGVVNIGRGSLIDCYTWPHPLPRVVK